MPDVDLEAAQRALELAADALGFIPPSAKPYPGEFVDGVFITWPQPAAAGAALNGWGCEIHGSDGEPIRTVSHVTVHAGCDHPVWAELEMFASEDGRPVREVPPMAGQPGCGDLSGVLGEDGEIRTATFAFLVLGMSTGMAAVPAVAAAG